MVTMQARREWSKIFKMFREKEPSHYNSVPGEIKQFNFKNWPKTLISYAYAEAGSIWGTPYLLFNFAGNLKLLKKNLKKMTRV